jgi:hypothetical protein
MLLQSKREIGSSSESSDEGGGIDACALAVGAHLIDPVSTFMRPLMRPGHHYLPSSVSHLGLALDSGTSLPPEPVSKSLPALTSTSTNPDAFGDWPLSLAGTKLVSGTSRDCQVTCHTPLQSALASGDVRAWFMEGCKS